VKLIDVSKAFATDEMCLAYLEAMRWPKGRVLSVPEYQSRGEAGKNTAARSATWTGVVWAEAIAASRRQRSAHHEVRFMFGG
jgi:hypothetical protein